MMQAANYINGLPRRMGMAMSAILGRDDWQDHRAKMHVIHAVQSDVESVPLDLTGESLRDALRNAAAKAARECYRYAERYKLASLVVDAIALLCHAMRVPAPAGATAKEIIARAIDESWWHRRIRTEHKRRLEHTSIRLGFTSVQCDPYVSREAALLQAGYNAANRQLMESRELVNEKGDVYTVADLADLGPANKAIRRGELMLRIRGAEEMATDMRHVGLFWTITCPSKYHSVGGANKKYNGATPREAQAYLCDVWKRIRSAFKRAGIAPYGFRIAEPHSDGCPHWHLLLFVQAEKEPAMTAIIRSYALQEDGTEAGAEKNRVKLVRIEAGKGTASGYIAKYVSKNIDGAGVGDHKTFEDGRTYTISTDIFGNEEITPSQRVTYWSQVWGIRQFQQIGGAPVGVWRELRRIRHETIANAPAAVVDAWRACQKIESADAAIAKQASYADYTRAQGGPFAGRGAVIRMATRKTTIEGKYGSYEAEKPCGVYHASNAAAVYESVRYRWTRKEVAGLAVAVPRTGVNNCTQPGKNAPWVAPKPAQDWLKNQKICSANVGPWWEEGRTALKLNAPAVEGFPDQSGYMGKFLRHRKAGEPAHLAILKKKYENKGMM